MASKAEKLRAILKEDRCHMVPRCWDALSAKGYGNALNVERTIKGNVQAGAACASMPITRRRAAMPGRARMLPNRHVPD